MVVHQLAVTVRYAPLANREREILLSLQIGKPGPGKLAGVRRATDSTVFKKNERPMLVFPGELS